MSRPPRVSPTLHRSRAFIGRVAFSERDRQRRAFLIVVAADRRPDVVIVGGGAAGLTAAYFAAQHGVQVPFAAQLSHPHPTAPRRTCSGFFCFLWAGTAIYLSVTHRSCRLAP